MEESVMQELVQDTTEVAIHEVLLGNFKITTKLLEDLEKYSQDYSLPLILTNFDNEEDSSTKLKRILSIDHEKIIGYIKIADRKYSTCEGGRVTVFGELKLIPTFESLYEEVNIALNEFSSPVHLVRLVKAYPVTIDNRIRRTEEIHQQILYARLAEPHDAITSMDIVLEIAKRNNVYDEI